jgi:hypothetical protein
VVVIYKRHLPTTTLTLTQNPSPFLPIPERSRHRAREGIISLLRIHRNHQHSTQAFQSPYRIMSFSPPTSSNFNSSDRSVEMLDSAMILVSISEGAPAPAPNSGYDRSRSSSADSESLNGWGTSVTRKTYKMDLSSLSSTYAMEDQPQQSSSSSMQCEDDWGYF